MRAAAATFLEATVLIAGGLFLLLGLRALGWVLRMAPLERARRDALIRGLPVVSAVLAMLYLGFAAQRLLAGRAQQTPLVAVVVLGAFAAAAWPALADVLSGVFIRAGRVCKEGDYVRIGPIAGRVERLGLRTLSIATGLGDEAVIPYGRLARESIFRTPVIEGTTVHVFRLSMPEKTALADVKRRIVEAAMRVHWSSIARQPQITATDVGSLEVTVFSLHPDRGPDIEAAVRRAVETDPPRRNDAVALDERPASGARVSQIPRR